MYFITILFDIQCYDFVSRAPSWYYNFSLVILRVNISLYLEGDTVPTRWRFYYISANTVEDMLRGLNLPREHYMLEQCRNLVWNKVMT